MFVQAQAQAMVQAAAQAQAVVAAAKNRGGGLVPMNAAQIAALSQIQAQAIVNARPQMALSGKPGVDPNEKPTPQQIQNQIQLQAQALVHAHTQAQISAGIYKGGEATPAATTAAAAAAAKKPPAAAPSATAALPPGIAKLPPGHPHPQPGQPTKQPVPLATSAASHPPPTQQYIPQPTPLAHAASHPHPRTAAPPQPGAVHPTQMPLMTQSAAKAPRPRPPSAVAAQTTTYMPSTTTIVPTSTLGGIPGPDGEIGGVIMPATSPEFLAKLNGHLTEFWAGQLQEMRVLGTDKVQTEQDFKNHNDLPLARIKRIMKSDEDVRMISAEAPVLFAKACEMFILEMTLRSWDYSENNKRKTLQKEDVKEAIQRTDIFDFLVDVIH